MKAAVVSVPTVGIEPTTRGFSVRAITQKILGKSSGSGAWCERGVHAGRILAGLAVLVALACIAWADWRAGGLALGALGMAMSAPRPTGTRCSRCGGLGRIGAGEGVATSTCTTCLGAGWIEQTIDVARAQDPMIVPPEQPSAHPERESRTIHRLMASVGTEYEDTAARADRELARLDAEEHVSPELLAAQTPKEAVDAMLARGPVAAVCNDCERLLPDDVTPCPDCHDGSPTPREAREAVKSTCDSCGMTCYRLLETGEAGAVELCVECYHTAAEEHLATHKRQIDELRARAESAEAEAYDRGQELDKGFV